MVKSFIISVAVSLPVFPYFADCKNNFAVLRVVDLMHQDVEPEPLGAHELQAVILVVELYAARAVELVAIFPDDMRIIRDSPVSAGDVFKPGIIIPLFLRIDLLALDILIAQHFIKYLCA